MARKISDEERLARNDFAFVQREYKKARTRIDKIHQELLIDMDKEQDIRDKMAKLEAKLDNAKTPQTMLKYQVELDALTLEYQDIRETQFSRVEKLDEFEKMLEFANDTFATRIPEGVELLRDMQMEEMEARANIRKVDLNTRAHKLEQKDGTLNLIKDNLNLDTDLKDHFDQMIKNQNITRELLIKKAQGKVLSPKEEDALMEATLQFNDNKKNIRSYCRTNGITGFDIREFEVAITKNKDLSAEEIFQLLIDENGIELEDVLEERQIVEDYYNEKAAELLKTHMQSQEVKQQEEAVKEEVKEAAKAEPIKLEPQRITSPGIQRVEPKQPLAEVTLWSKFKKKLSGFAKKIKTKTKKALDAYKAKKALQAEHAQKQDVPKLQPKRVQPRPHKPQPQAQKAEPQAQKAEPQVTQSEQPKEKAPKPEYSNEFKKRMKSSAYLQDKLEEHKVAERSELDRKIEQAKKQKKARTTKPDDGRSI